MTCGTGTRDDHPTNIKGSKGPYRFVKTLDTANAKAAPTTRSSGSALADRPGPAANTTTPMNASTTPADVVRDGLSASSGQARRTVKGGASLNAAADIVPEAVPAQE